MPYEQVKARASWMHDCSHGLPCASPPDVAYDAETGYVSCRNCGMIFRASCVRIDELVQMIQKAERDACLEDLKALKKSFASGDSSSRLAIDDAMEAIRERGTKCQP